MSEFVQGKNETNFIQQNIDNVANILINLLIIDPQNDFNDDPQGTLPVTGASSDCANIAQMLKYYNGKGKINSINISLDTHTKNHIANASLWKITGFYDNLSSIKDNIDKGIPIPSVTKVTLDGNKWIGTPLVLSLVDKKLIQFRSPWGARPLIIEPDFTKLSADIITTTDTFILNAWFQAYYNAVKDKNGLTLWNDHCIETTKGHEVVKILKDELLKYGNNKVKYHIKGQNCLVEMFSIMKADVVYEDLIDPAFDLFRNNIGIIKKNNKAEIKDIKQAELIDINKFIEILKTYKYTGGVFEDLKKIIDKTSTDIPEEIDSIKKSMLSEESSDKTTHIYLETKFNDTLFNDITKNNHPIVICGEALTHCVLNSFKDILEKLDSTNKPNELWIIGNASSAIGGSEEKTIQYFNSIKDNVKVKFKKINTTEGAKKGEIIDSTFDEFLSFGLKKTGGRRRTLRKKHMKFRKINKKKTNKRKINKRRTIH